MSIDPSPGSLDEDNLLLRLTEEISEIRAQYASKEKQIRDLSQELDRLKSAGPQESEQRFRSLFEAMSEGFALHEIICNAHGKPCDYRFLEVNPAFERLTGLKRQDLLGRRVKEVMPGTEAHWIDNFGRVALTGEPLRMEEFSRELGRWYNVFAYRTEPGRFAVVFTDSTERKRHEEALRTNESRYRELVQNANSVIIRWSQEGKLTFFNEFAEKFFGWKAEEVIGEHVGILIPERESAGRDLSGLVQDIVAHPEHYTNNINENVCRDGRRVWMAWTNRAIRDERGNVTEILAIGSDVSDLWQVEAALRESEEKFRSAFANAAIGFAMTTPDGRFLDANPAYCRLTGYHLDELRRLAFPQIIHPDDFGENMRRIDQMLTGDTASFVLENRYVRKDGDVVWVRKSVSIVRGAGGMPRWIIALVEDVSDRRQVEKALRHSREDLDRAQEVGAIGSWRLDVNRNILTWSHENHRIFGVPRGTPLSYETFLGIVHPDDRWYVDKMWKAALAGEPYDIEHRLLVNGQMKWVREKAFLEFDNAGILKGGFGITQDITERKHAEEALRASEKRYRQLFETASEGIWQIDAEFRTVDLNEGMARMLGCRREEVIGRYVSEFMAPTEMTDVQRRMQNRRRGLSEAYERLLLRKDGSTLWSLVSVTPLRDDEGNVVGSFGMFTDISERKRAEEQLLRLNETLELQVSERTALADARSRQLQALAVELTESEERERRRVAQLLHDDLQQMLAAARMQLETACEDLPSDPMLGSVVRMLGEAMDKSRHLSHELSPAVLRHSGLTAALKWLGGQLQEKFGLQVQFESDLPRQVDDSSLKAFLYRAVQELLFNIVKHAGVKSARVALSVSDGRLEVVVSDQGLGFDPEILDSHDAAAGFGLMSIRERARYMGGNLLIESSPKQGSRFTLAVPVPTAGAAGLKRRAADRKPLPQAEDFGSSITGSIRMLLVDDHPLMRKGLIKLTRSQPGIQVVGEATNGCEAVERVRQLQPDLVLMDVSMPEMNGIEATRRIKAELPNTRVLGLSAHEDDFFAREMLAAGAEAFLSKSASPAELLKAIYGGPRQTKDNRNRD